MIKKKTIISLSLLVLPITCNVTSCNKTSIERESLSNNNDENDNDKTKKISNRLKNDEEVKEMHVQINEIKSFLNQGIDGSKDFTPSQSLADNTVQKKIIEKVKTLCGNPKNINFIPQLKSQYFKAGNENYVDVEIIYTKKDFQINSTHHNLQIKNVKQDLKEVVDKALEDLKNPIDFSKSSLIEYDDFNFDLIENNFINVLNNQLEQEDERLTIKLVNKSQDLVNNRKIEVEVIGKDDNEEIKRKIQITPIKLVTLNDYNDALIKRISITRDDKLFANNPPYTPYYWKYEVTRIIKSKFEQLNENQLQKREIESFEYSLINPNITFKKGTNLFPISIKLKYNKLFTNIALALLEIENHPEFILNQVVNHFVNNDIDLSNEPIFENDKFDSDDIKDKIIEIMEMNKSGFDEKNDIKIKINHYLSWSKQYLVTFSHQNPGIIARWRDSSSIQQTVQLKKIQTSPQQDLNYFMKIPTVKASIQNSITISQYHFENLGKWDSAQFPNLREINAYLESYLDGLIREKALSFSKLSDMEKLNVQIVPITVVSKSDTNIKVKYEFKFKKLGVTASDMKIITFIK